MMVAPNLLFVAWQDSDSRRIVPVGRIVQLDGRFQFAYVKAVLEAQKLGFEPLLSFPELHEVYESHDLPPLLSNRLMPRGRPEFAAYLEELGLSVDHAAPFTVLARSGGRRTTDRLEVFAPPTRGNCEYGGLFLARGVRHVPGSEAALTRLSAGSKLFVMADVQNEVNSSALALRNAEKHLLAYVPDYLANELAASTGGDCARLLQVDVERINPSPAPVHHRLLCRFRVPTHVGDELFRGDGYAPLSIKASQSAA